MKWIRNLLKGVSLTAAMFVFQACYGTMEMYDEAVTIRVVSAETGLPLSGIAVSETPLRSDSTEYQPSYAIGITDEDGTVTSWAGGGLFRYNFFDSADLFAPKDTIVNLSETGFIEVALKNA